MVTRSDVVFDVHGDRCAAWFYIPDSEPPFPCVVMGHGFGCTRRARMDDHAQRFAAAGAAVIVFDYRHFGDSEGEPRQLLDIKKQLEDWTAAISDAVARDDVAGRIALWGASFGAGHVVTTAARDSRVAAIIAQSLFADGFFSARHAELGHSARLLRAGLRDWWARSARQVALPDRDRRNAGESDDHADDRSA